MTRPRERSNKSPAYVELRCQSAFSFLDGASLPEELACRAAELGYRGLALGDRGGVYGIPRFQRAAHRLGLPALVAAEVEIAGHPLRLLCETPAGYRNLCRLITTGKLRRSASLTWNLTWNDLAEQASGLFALGGGGEGAVGAAIDRGDRAAAVAAFDRLLGIFGREHLAMELQVHLDALEDRRNLALMALARRHRLLLVATNDVRYARPEQAELYDVLLCIREGMVLDDAGRRLPQSAERFLRSPAEMAALFADLPEALDNTLAVTERCAFRIGDLGYRFPDYPLPPGESEAGFLAAMVHQAAPSRFRPCSPRAQAQLDRELALIARLGLAGYFLIVWDLVQFCRSRGILCQGRGSAANSAVCFALGITACDPVKMDLLFERFLSEERGEWPDIDLDLPSGERREQVIQYVYKKYGQRGCAMTANVITYRGRSAVRDVGKALGLPGDRLARLSALLHRFEFGAAAVDDITAGVTGAGLDPADERVRRFVRLCAAIQDLPRHLGQHSGGMVVAAGRLDEVVPLQPAAMPGRVVIQWDKDDCADLKIIKIDLLGLGMMAVLEEAVRLCPRHDGVALDLAALPPDDPAVYAMLRRADTIGVFQVESRAQMATLPRMKPERFYDLVVEVALIRPGPIIGQMVHPYLRRRNHQEAVSYAHPSLEPILARTLGVPLFQEQVMRMAMVAAGFSGGQAEELRRAIGFKRSSDRMAEIEAALRAGMAARGIGGAAADEIVHGIVSFAQYGFPESHSISFALIAYASAYLKLHHPAVFYTALLNAWPMGFYQPATLVKDAQRHGVRVLPVDVCRSQWECTVEDAQPGETHPGETHPGGAGRRSSSPLCPPPEPLPRPAARTFRLGLRYVRGLRRQAAEALLAARAAAPLRSLADLCRRCPELSAVELSTLAEIGAMAGLPGQPRRRDALWQACALAAARGGLLGAAVAPAGEHAPLAAMSLAERVAADYAGTALSLGPHPLAFFRQQLARRGVLAARDLEHARLPAGELARVAGAVIVRQRPMTAKGFFFMTLEDETGIANVIVTPRHFEENRAILRSASAILVEGVLQRHDGVVSVKGQRFTDLAHLAEAAPDAHLLAPLAGHDGSTAEHDGAEHRTATRRTA